MSKKLENRQADFRKAGFILRAAFFHVLLIGLLAIPEIISGQQQKYSFQHLSVEHGLSHPSVHCILQDSRGFLWIGTEYGLNRFDGRTFKIYSHDQKDSLSISGTAVFCLFEDKTNTLWVGTDNGLNRFDRFSETFTYFGPIAGDSTSLSSGTIAAILESTNDTTSLWIATDKGLNKLDLDSGKFTRFLHDPANPYSLSENGLRFITEDDDGFLWIGTWGAGVNRFDPRHRGAPIFERHLLEPSAFSNESANSVRAGAKHPSGVLWFGTWGGAGLFKYDPQTAAFTNYKPERNNPNSLYRGFIENIFIDSNNMIWICDGVLTRFNPRDESFVHIKFHQSQGEASSSYWPMTSYEDRSHNLWVGTFGNGLYKIDLKPQKSRHYVHDPGDSTSLSDNDIAILYESRGGALWIATRNNGLNRFDPEDGTFTHFKHDPATRHSLNHNAVRAIIEDSDGYMWAGTPAGLNRIDPENGHVGRYLSAPAEIVNLAERDAVQAICEDHAGILWIGTFAGDLYKFDKRHETSKKFTVPIESYEARYNDILDIYEDQFNNLWIAAWKTFYRFDRRGETFVRIKGAAPDDNGKLGEKIYHTRNGSLWGLNRALSTVDMNTSTVHRFRPFPNASNSSADDWAYNKPYGFHEDARGMIWCGTRMGLHKFDPQLREFVSHDYEGDGLLSNFVFQITGDDFGNLWVLTNRGISIFNENKPPGERFMNLSAEHGIDNTATSHQAFIKSKRGDIYWGGSNGIYRFHPEVQNTNPLIPKIRITDFRIFDENVELDSAISEISTITLTYNQNFFSFSFTALDFTNPLQNQYAYKLEGIDEDWVKAGNKTEASYTNVPPGRYVFSVKGSNDDGVWNEEGVSVNVIITPPWWRTNLAYAVYFILIAAALFGWRRFEVNRVTLRKELNMKRFEAQKLQEIDHLKSRFFANISHEFRTPLTLILGPVEQMLSGEFKGNLREHYRMIFRNARRLLQLINQLLDLSRLESGRMTLLARPEDLVSLVKGIAQSFASWAERKRITLNFYASQKSIIGYVDRDKLEKIVSNLLSNAFKFTPEGGSVEVRVERCKEEWETARVGERENGRKGKGEMGRRGESVEIMVRDTGPGIPPEHAERIFNRFYQVEMTDTRRAEGAGIGLALAKELVELHHGEILVNSEVDKGTTFEVRLPLGKKHRKPGEIVEEVISEQLPVTSELLSVISDLDVDDRAVNIEQPATGDQQPATSRSEAEIPIHQDDETIILVVEDNRDVRTYVRHHLEPAYKVREANDGAEGVETALEIIPDLIISDVMMPKMDGYELCRTLKTDEKTSHVPIILLTAKASSENKVSGLETGADDYLIKPFDSKELLARVKNLIRLRRQLRERFGREITLQPKEIAVTSADERFLQRAMEIVDEHISDSAFNVEQFVRSIGMSQTQLHRKLKALTDQSAIQFIRALRLKRAAFLLQMHTGNVAEIAYEVGFNNPSYFAECFRKQFGVLPSQYAAPSFQSGLDKNA